MEDRAPAPIPSVPDDMAPEPGNDGFAAYRAMRTTMVVLGVAVAIGIVLGMA